MVETQDDYTMATQLPLQLLKRCNESRMLDLKERVLSTRHHWCARDPGLLLKTPLGNTIKRSSDKFGPSSESSLRAAMNYHVGKRQNSV